MRKSNKFTSLRVSEDNHTRIKTLASIKGQKINDFIEDLSLEKMREIGIKPLNREVKRKKYDFKI